MSVAKIERRTGWLGVAISVAMLGLVGSAGAATGQREAANSPTEVARGPIAATFGGVLHVLHGDTLGTTWFGPMAVSAGQSTTLHIVNTDSISHNEGLTIFDPNGATVASSSGAIDPHASVALTYVWVSSANGVFARLRSQGPLVKGTFEVSDAATPSLLTAATALLGGAPSVAIGGPVTMSGQLTEEVALTLATGSAGTATMTFYDSAGSVLEVVNQTIDYVHTITQTFPDVPEGESVHVEVTISGTSKSILGAVLGLDGTGRSVWREPLVF